MNVRGKTLTFVFVLKRGFLVKFRSLVLACVVGLGLSHHFAFAQYCGSVNGIAIPCWNDFLGDKEGDESLPLYPYAKRPNGCSIPGFIPGKLDSFIYSDYQFNFRDVCIQHDYCYYTLGTDAQVCNEDYAIGLKRECERGYTYPLSSADFLSAGAIRLAAIQHCHAQAGTMITAVFTSQYIFHADAQEMQRTYLGWVQAYVNSLTYVAPTVPTIPVAPIVPPTPTAPALERFEVSIKSRCDQVVRFAFKFVSLSGEWADTGFLEVLPGTEYKVIATTNRYFAFYAETADKSLVWEDINSNITLNDWDGSTVYLRPVDLGSEFHNYTQNITCHAPGGTPQG